MNKRAILIVMDSVGIGAMPDAAKFGDEGSHTLGNILKVRGHLDIPNLMRLGLGQIEDARLGTSVDRGIVGAFGRAKEVSRAKDTTSGHWEICGVIMDEPFKTYPNGFGKELMDVFEKKIGIGTLGNVVASGTQIINELGDEHVRTGKPIIYTSADSVFQIAAHEGIIPVERLYEMCNIAREILVGDNLVGRVIARPFIGENGSYTRTQNRKDYAVAPVKPTVLDGLVVQGYDTFGIGKIEDIFAHRGIMKADHARNNVDGINATIEQIKSGKHHLIFTNLVDFDMLYGHRNDVEGYAAALEYFDTRLPEIIEALLPEDLLIITADHGCDPTTKSTDHSREYIPVLAYTPKLKSAIPLGTLDTFSDIGASVYAYICDKRWNVGKSFLQAMECGDK